MFAVYTILGGIWGFLCFRHKEDILPIQVSALDLFFTAGADHLIVLSFRPCRIPDCGDDSQLR
jgi:hypothetical protein